MRFWMISFLALFGMAELFQWIRHFSVPLPMFILGGALLAIASNYNKLINWSLQDTTPKSPLLDSANSPLWNTLNPSQSKPAFQLPRSISFTINRSDKLK